MHQVQQPARSIPLTEPGEARRASGQTSRRLRLDLPALIERPSLTGSLCCAPAAAELIEDELRSWRLWVTSANVDAEHGDAEITLIGDPPLQDMLEALHDLGYPVEQVTTLA
jgi:hypothetical protein